MDQPPPPPAADPPPGGALPEEGSKAPWKSLMWVFILVGSVQLLCCTCCGGGLWIFFHKPAARHEMTPLERAAGAEAVQAGDMEQDYLDNAAHADSLYRGKFFRIAGIVSSKTRDSLGMTYVGLATSELNQPVVCIVGPQDAEAPKLKEGDQVIIAGTCDGYNINHVRVKDAFVVEVHPR